MPEQIDSAPEYAVEVPDRGFSAGVSPVFFTLADEPVYSVSLADTKAHQRQLQQHYINLGCPDIALTVRIVSRTVTVTRGDWEPLVEVGAS